MPRTTCTLCTWPPGSKFTASDTNPDATSSKGYGMSLAAVMSGGTKCSPAETLVLVAANPTQTSNATTSSNLEFRLMRMRSSFSATMIAFSL